MFPLCVFTSTVRVCVCPTVCLSPVCLSPVCLSPVCVCALLCVCLSPVCHSVCLSPVCHSVCLSPVCHSVCLSPVCHSVCLSPVCLFPVCHSCVTVLSSVLGKWLNPDMSLDQLGVNSKSRLQLRCVCMHAF